MSIRRTNTRPKLNPAAEIGIVGTLRKGVFAHQIQSDIGRDAAGYQQETATAHCNGRQVRRYSYGWAAQHGARLCGNCFGGAA